MLRTFLISLKQAASGLCLPHTSKWPQAWLAAAGLCSQFGLSWAPSSPAEVAAICRSLCSSQQLVPGRVQVVADLYFAGGPRARASSGQLQTTPDYRPTTMSYTVNRYQRPTEASLVPYGWPLQSSSSSVVRTGPYSQLAWGVNPSQWC